MTHLPKPAEGSGDFTPPPAGTFPAVCYRLVDLGTQDITWKGEHKTQHKVLISWEIQDEEAVMEDGRPMSIHSRYTWSMHEKAKLRKDLEAWRGAKFKDSDFGPGGFDVKKLLGAPCMISIVHNETEGKTYANIASIAKLPKGLKAAPLHNEKLFLWLDESFDEEVFNTLSDGIKDTIRKSPEFHELFGPGKGNEYRAAKGGGKAPVDEEIPF